MKKKTRLKMAQITDFFLAGVTIYSISEGMENVAMSAIGGIMTITMLYIGGDSYRKSLPEEPIT